MTPGGPGARPPEERRHAEALGLAADTATPELLVDLLGDPSWRVRKAALSRVAALHARADLVPALVAALADSENAGLRSACAEALTTLGDVAVPALVRALATPDVDLRKFVVEVLGSSRSAQARDSLVAALEDPDDNVRSAVISALGAMGDAEVIRALRQRLAGRSTDPQLLAYLLDALDRLRAELTLEELAPFLARPELARLISPLLGRCVDPKAAELLVQSIATGTRRARLEAIRALGGHPLRRTPAGRETLRAMVAGAAGAIDALEAALEDPDEGADEGVVEAAVNLLGLLGDPERAPRLLAAVASHPFVRSAIDAIRPLGARVVGPLLGALDLASTEARVLFLEILESVGDATAIPKLLLVAASVEPRSAEAAVSALGKLAGPEHTSALMGVARDGEAEIVRQTALALAALGMRHPAEVATELRSAVANGDVRPIWIVVLGLIGREEDRDTIVAASRHRDPEVRRAALEAFAGYGDRIDEDVAILALADENAGVRAAAAHALGAFHSERVVDVLLAATGDADPLVVADALKALGGAGGRRAAAALLDAAASSSAPVAIAALQSLFRLRPEGLAVAVEHGLAHVDAEVVREALVLTMRLPADAAVPYLTRCLEHRSWHARLAAAEMLDNRALPVAEELVEKVLEAETEPLVKQALARLTPRRKGVR